MASHRLISQSSHSKGHFQAISTEPESNPFRPCFCGLSVTVISTSITDRCTARSPLRKAFAGLSAPRMGAGTVPTPEASRSASGRSISSRAEPHTDQVYAEVLPRVAARAVSGPMDCIVHQ